MGPSMVLYTILHRRDYALNFRMAVVSSWLCTALPYREAIAVDEGFGSVIHLTAVALLAATSVVHALRDG
ncbi:hypothetical protein CVT26_008724 [Gymnopilus dilepis]|uniref:Uncharacterized protein n=1 Tax=Gymnopilus dilepis TaxID=231916 RepID=A0A409YG92_9AGAR|nr:hypothetical protein CVT26_008724 [Gymnopilus dilepis]